MGHAEEMVEVLSSPDLYVHTGGTPPTREGLERLYRLQTAGGPPSGDEGWLNWVIRRTRSRAAVGYVQATVTGRDVDPTADVGRDAGHDPDVDRDGELTADVAWVVGRPHQGRGYATEAAAAMIAWLREQEVRGITASIHPDNRASTRVAAHLGLEPTGEFDDDGEEAWALRG